MNKKEYKEYLKKYREILLYLVFGVLTTVINIISFFLLSDILKINWMISNVAAWIISVLFAYFTNKKYVFESKNKNVIKEFTSFIVCRVLSLGIDMAVMKLLIDVLSINKLFSKIVSNVIVIIANYIFSKFLIFKGK